VEARIDGRFVPANGLDMYVREQGNGAPLLLLHGGSADGSEWEPVVPFLAERFRVIRPDSRGHGRTANPSGFLSYGTMTDDVAALIEALALDAPVVCGWSDGGQVALDLAIRYPHLVRALAVGGVRFRQTPEYIQQIKDVLCVEPGGVNIARFARFNPDWVARMDATQSHRGDPRAWETLIHSIAYLWLSPFGLDETNLASISAPTLLIAADGDLLAPPEEALAMYRLVPNAVLSVFPASDHSLPWTRPDAFAGLVGSFLSSEVRIPA